MCQVFNIFFGWKYIRNGYILDFSEKRRFIQRLEFEEICKGCFQNKNVFFINDEVMI